MKYVTIPGALVALLFSLCLLSGCESPPPIDPRVRILDSSLQRRLVLTDLKEIERGNKTLDIQVTGDCTRDSDQRIEYRFEWFDDNGVLIRSRLSRWMPMTVAGNSAFTINGVSPSSKASDFKLSIRKEK